MVVEEHPYSDYPSFLDGWQQCRDRSDVRLSAVEAAHNTRIGSLTKRTEELEAELTRLKQWVNELQSGRHINCAYCGFSFGPADTPVSMADALREHIEQCPQHPMSALKAENDQLRTVLSEIATLPPLEPDTDPFSQVCKHYSEAIDKARDALKGK